MKALSIKEPWASLILEGKKTIETRTWITHYRGSVILCASKTPVSDISGKAFALADIVDCREMTKEDVEDAMCNTYPNAKSWVLKNVRPVVPFEVKGSLGLFDIPKVDCEICAVKVCPKECFNSHSGSMIALRKVCNATGQKVHIIGEQQAGKEYARKQLCQSN